MNMAKLSIKGLIESALNLGRTLDSDYAPLQQFFVVMEHCLKHGLKSRSSPPPLKVLLNLSEVLLGSAFDRLSMLCVSAKKTFLGQNKSFWGALELVEKLTPEAGEITASVKDLPGLRSVCPSVLRVTGELFSVLNVPAWRQNPPGARPCLVTPGADAEEALRLHENHHQQEGPAQVCT